MTSSSYETSQLAFYQALLGDEKPPTAARARRAFRDLAAVQGPETQEAYELAARFTEFAPQKSEMLLKPWRDAADRDAFARLLVAPAFAREGRTRFELGRKLTLDCGIRHLTSLRTLRVFQRKDLTELSGVAAITGLVELDLEGSKSLGDIGPLTALTGLRTLNLHNSAVHDLTPLAGMTGLVTLVLSGCRELTELGPLAALTGLEK